MLFTIKPVLSQIQKLNIHLSTYQCAFQRMYFTDFYLSYLNGRILKGFDKGMMTGMILNYLQKAFDTIDHDVLLQKMYTIDFLKHAVNCFKSYLSSYLFWLI